jgi:hypothetical protein
MATGATQGIHFYYRMTAIKNRVLYIVIIALFAAAGQVCRAENRSKWAYLDSSGKLAYGTLPQGDRIMDFSAAGYEAAESSIPEVSSRATVSPTGGDDTANIQRAIDLVSRMSLVDGHRGAVQLTAGIFNCESAIRITTGGVVLRGVSGTILRLSGSPHPAISASGSLKTTPQSRATAITDSYIPSGSDTFSVASTAGLAVGDTVQITHPATPDWVRFMGMADLVRNGKQEHWVSGTLETTRVIKAIKGNKITVTVPLADNYDSKYLNPPSCTVEKVTVSGAISQVGVEHLAIECPPQAITINDPAYEAVRFTNVEDSWARDLDCRETVGTMDIGSGCSRITVQRVNITHSVATKGAAKFGEFACNGTQILFDRCTCDGNNTFYFVTFGRVQGPNVLLNCTFHGNGSIQPHMRWSTGLLIDGCSCPEGGINLQNRGIMGSGHGWAIGWAVAWNCRAKSLLIQQPPGSMNWAIGCTGTVESEPMPGTESPKLPNGLADSPNREVTPKSLYLQQLKDRLGPEALRNLGY